MTRTRTLTRLLRARVLAGAAVTAVCAGLLLPAQAQAAGSVHLYKIFYDSPGSDTGSTSSLNAEYVQIRNTTSAGVNLRNWTLRDAAGHTYTFGSYTLGAGRTVTVHTGRGSHTTAHRYWGRSWYVWNNTSDTARLRRANGTTADTCSYDSSRADYVMC
jgi:hypothetical protein